MNPFSALDETLRVAKARAKTEEFETVREGAAIHLQRLMGMRPRRPINQPKPND